MYDTLHLPAWLSPRHGRRCRSRPSCPAQTSRTWEADDVRFL